LTFSSVLKEARDQFGEGGWQMYITSIVYVELAQEYLLTTNISPSIS
jgi:hypothetical protein